MQYAYLAFHRIGVQLAHIAATIVLGNGFDVQIPCIGIGMRYADTWVMSNDMLVNGLNGFCIGLDPANLRKIEIR